MKSWDEACLKKSAFRNFHGYDKDLGRSQYNIYQLNSLFVKRIFETLKS